MKKSFEIEGKVWIWPGGSFAWYFIHIDKEVSYGIRKKFPKSPMVPVEVKVGRTVWKTTLFRNKKDENYILPIKKDVRQKESIMDKDELKFKIKIL